MQTDKEKRSEAAGGTKYSVAAYLIVFFVLVIALVLLSYFVQGRRNSSSYAQLRTEYLQSLEQHGDRLDDLYGEIGAQQARIEALEQALSAQTANAEALAGRAEDAETRAAELEKELETLRSELDALQETVRELENTENEE